MIRTVPGLAALLVIALLPSAVGLVSSPAGAGSVYRVPKPDWSRSAMRNLTEYENRVVHYVNKRRTARGLRRIRFYDTCLDGFAERWARHLADTGRFYHQDLRRVLRRCDQSWVGETLGRGGMAPRRLVRLWMQSTSHRAILLKVRAKRVGVGAKRASDGRLYVSMILGDHG